MRLSNQYLKISFTNGSIMWALESMNRMCFYLLFVGEKKQPPNSVWELNWEPSIIKALLNQIDNFFLPLSVFHHLLRPWTPRKVFTIASLKWWVFYGKIHHPSSIRLLEERVPKIFLGRAVFQVGNPPLPSPSKCHWRSKLRAPTHNLGQRFHYFGIRINVLPFPALIVINQ